MPASHPPLLRFAPFALVLAAFACDEPNPSDPLEGVPAALVVEAGDGQEAVAGDALDDALTVQVVDAHRWPVQGAEVRFAVVAGGGQITEAAGTTDRQGMARTRWTLGTVAADSQVVEATLASAPGVAPLRLRARVRADEPATLQLAGGSGGAGPVGAALADSLAVTVKDRFGNPVVGLEVAWEAAAGGGALSPARARTGADGVAKAQWTLGPRVDSVQVALARVAGLDSVAFTANAVTAGAPLQLAKRGGDGQRGPAGAVLADSLAIWLRMPDGRPVAGAVVTWAVPAGAGTVAPLVSRTDATGAAAAVWRLGTAPGLAQATATVDSGTLVFTSLVQAAAPAAVAAVAGGGDGPVGAPLDSLAVRVTDAFGNPVPGAEVAWSALAGGGSLHPAVSAAGADGVARAQWILGPDAASPQSARAAVGGLPPVAFSARGVTRGAPLQLAKRGGDGQRGPVGSVLLDSLGVVLRLPDGRPVAGAEVAWDVASGGGAIVSAVSRTDANGAASAVWRLGTELGLARATATVDGGTLVFTARVEADEPGELEIVGGNGATGGVGQRLADSLAVRVTDRHGNPVAGAAVAWSVLSGGGSLSPATSTADSLGVARARWTLGPAVGAGHRARAVVVGVLPAEFTATAATAGVPLQLARAGGEGQRGPIGSVLADSLRVVLRLPDGRPVSGALVRWNVVEGRGTVTPETSRTDANGHASALWRLGTRAGLTHAGATVDGGTVLFRSFTEPDGAAAMGIVSGGAATGGVGQPLADSVAVRVVDQYGNPVPGVEVLWSVRSGGGSITPAQSTADSLGIARAAWTLGPRVGSQSAWGEIQWLQPAALSATAGTAGVPLQLSLGRGGNQQGTVGQRLADSLVVFLRLPDGRAVQGATVAWSAAHGSISPATRLTNGGGRASAAWTLGTAAGVARASATVDQGTLGFVATASAGPAAAVEVVGGSGATGGIGQALADSLVARVTDQYGNPVPGTVTWAAAPGHGSVEPQQAQADAQGVARARWTLGLVVDSVQRATATAGTATPAQFTATGTTQGVALELVRRGGDGQSGRVGTRLPNPLMAEVRTPAGLPVRNVPVAWAVTGGGGSVSPASVRTGAQGRASTEWTLGSTAGPGQATATVDQGTLTFSATQTATPVLNLEILTGNGVTATRGMPVGASLRVTDAAGQPVADLELELEVLEGGGRTPYLTVPNRVRTNSSGIAGFIWVMGPQAGTNRVAARIYDGEAVFTATAVQGSLQLVTFDGVVVLQLLPNHTSTYSVPGATWVAVADDQGNFASGMTIQYLPNRGDPAGSVVTGDDGAYIGWYPMIRRGDSPMPELRIVWEDQELGIQTIFPDDGHEPEP